MTSPYLGEIRLFAGNYAPDGWLPCDGRTLQISEYDTLYVLLGTAYGGDGQTNFNLPDLRSRVPIGISPTYEIGTMAGVQDVTLTTATMPSHTHQMFATSGPASTATPSAGTSLADQVGGETQTVYVYAASGAAVAMSGQSIRAAGGTTPHTNMQPFVTVNYIIATQGEYPTPP